MQSVNLSIIIPMYNGEKTISSCLHSILRQVGKDSEVIVIDDGSKDQSLQVVRTIAENDSRVVIFTKENGGVSSARNAGICIANGKYIMFIDCDDHLEDGYFSSFMKRKEYIDAKVIVLSRINVHYADTDYLILEGESIETESFLCIDRIVDIWENHLWNSPVNKVYLKEIIVDNNIRFDTSVKMGEDWLFNNAYLRALKPKALYLIGDAFYDYYLDSDPWRHCKQEEFYENNKKQVDDFKYTLEMLNVSKNSIARFDKIDLDFTITELKRIARDQAIGIKERIIRIDKLLKKETVASRVIDCENYFAKLDVREFSSGSAIYIFICENLRKRLGLVRKKYIKK